eukprot:5665562-Ditylum_brightwellii.AAC.1
MQTIKADTGKDLAVLMVKKELGMHMKHQVIYFENKKRMHSIIYTQGSEAMQAKLEGNTDFAAIANAFDVTKPMKSIKKISYQYKSQ